MSSFLLKWAGLARVTVREFLNQTGTVGEESDIVLVFLCHILKEMSHFVTMTLFYWTAIQRLLKFWVFIDTWWAILTHWGPYQALNPICIKQKNWNSESESE